MRCLTKTTFAALHVDGRSTAALAEKEIKRVSRVKRVEKGDIVASAAMASLVSFISLHGCLHYICELDYGGPSPLPFARLEYRLLSLVPF